MEFSQLTRRGFVKLSAATGLMGATVALAGCKSGKDSKGDGRFKIGQIGPLTGPTAIYGTATDFGAQVAIDEINAKGGSIQFDYKVEDDANVAETSVNAYNSLKDWGMQILVGTTTTAPCVAVSDKTNADNMFELTPSASSNDVIGGQPDAKGNISIERKENVFQMCFTDPNQGKAAVKTLKEKSLGTKIAIIYDNSDPYSSGIAEGFKKEAKSEKLEIVTEQTFTSDSNTNFSSQLSKCQESGADVLFLPIYYQQAGLILKQAKDMGFAPTFFGCDGMDGLLTQENFDASLAEGLVLITPFSADATDEATQNFVEAFKKLSDGTVPNQFAADAYDCVNVIALALEKIDATPDMETAELCDKLIEVFTDKDFVFNGLTGSDMTWDETGMISKVPACYVIQDGKYVAM